MKTRNFIILQLASIIYSLATIPSKLASNEVFLSSKYCIFLCTEILILFLYAVLWQQILKKIPLNVAYVGKATTLFWSMVIGFVVFNEKITFFNVLGVIIVITGIIIIIKGEQKSE